MFQARDKYTIHIKLPLLYSPKEMQDLLPISSCFYSGEKPTADNPTTTTTATTKLGQSLVLSTYRALISGESHLITITWCKNLLALGLYISIDFSHQTYSCKVEMRPWHFWRRHGTKRFNVDKNPIDVFWDLKNAKFSEEPEPISDFYVAVVSNDEVVLLLGDQKHDAFRRTGSRPSMFDAILVCKKEYVFGKRKFTTRARFDEKGKLDHEICVEINGSSVDSDMLIKIDGNVLVEIKHLQWKFRGHGCVNVEKVRVEVYWDVHDWLFSSNGLRHALFIFKPMAASSSSSSAILDQRDATSVDNGCGDGSSDFCLFLYAWKLD